jgi:hypothetical protein
MFPHYYAIAGRFEALVREIDVRALVRRLFEALVCERRFCALVLQNHSKSTRLFEHLKIIRLDKLWFTKYHFSNLDTLAQMTHSLLRRS